MALGATLLTLPALLLALLLPPAASAHVSVTPDTAVAGEQAVLVFEIDHGCDESPTTSLEIGLPDQLDAVTPAPTRTWEVEGNTETLLFTATTPLPSDLPDSVTLVLDVPDSPGELLAFPTVQSCVEGEEAWIQIPAEGTYTEELERPAPLVRIISAEEARGEDDGVPGSGAGGPSERTEDHDSADDPEGGSGDGSAGPLWFGLGIALLAVLTAGIVVSRRRS